MDRFVLQAWRELETAHATSVECSAELQLRAGPDREIQLSRWVDAIDRESAAADAYIRALDAMHRAKGIRA